MSGRAAGKTAVVGAWQHPVTGDIVYFETRRGAELTDPDSIARGNNFEVAVCVYTSTGVILSSDDTSATLIPYCSPDDPAYRASQAPFETYPGITAHTTGYVIARQAFNALPRSGFSATFIPEMNAVFGATKGFGKLARGGLPPGIKGKQYRQDMHNGGTPGIGIPPPGAPTTRRSSPTGATVTTGAYFFYWERAFSYRLHGRYWWESGMRHFCQAGNPRAAAYYAHSYH